MKSTQLVFLLLFSISTMISCKKHENKEVAIKEYNHIKKANWFLGDWQNISKEAEMKEIWVKQNDSTFVAESFVTVKKDTVFHEKVDLVQRNDSLFYIVSVKNQNNEKPISFYMTKSTESELVFENPKHDFPSKIIYKKITNDSLVATVSGLQNGKKMEEIFPMNRK